MPLIDLGLTVKKFIWTRFLTFIQRRPFKTLDSVPYLEVDATADRAPLSCIPRQESIIPPTSYLVAHRSRAERDPSTHAFKTQLHQVQ